MSHPKPTFHIPNHLSPPQLPLCSHSSAPHFVPSRSFRCPKQLRGSQPPRQSWITPKRDLPTQLGQRSHAWKRLHTGTRSCWAPSGQGRELGNRESVAGQTRALQPVPSQRPVLTIQLGGGPHRASSGRSQRCSHPASLHGLHLRYEQGGGFPQELLPAHGGAELPLLQRLVHGQRQPVGAQPGARLQVAAGP